MRLSLITSPYVDYGSWLGDSVEPKLTPYISLGLLSLAASARTKNADVSLFDVNVFFNSPSVSGRPLQDRYRAAADSILEQRPDIVGFMTEYYTYHHVLGVAAHIRAIDSSVMIILGGPQATATDLATLQRFDQVDLIVRGEAETTIQEMLDRIATDGDLSGVPGITLRRGSEIVRTPSRQLIRNLDDLPIPAFDLVQIKPGDLVMLEAGRGCPFSCAFCSTNDFWHRQYRMKSPARIVYEMRILHDTFGVRDVSLIHDCLTANQKEVIALCDALISANLNQKWGCSSRTDTISPALMERMKDAGCGHIYFGIESGDAEIQRFMNKNLDLAASFEIIRAARNLGIEVTTPFMIGFPGESRSQVSSTFERIFQALAEDVYLAQIFSVAPYGDTPLLRKFADSIVYDGHFLDLPQQPIEQSERDRVMTEAPDVFSGHYRYRAAEDTPQLSGIDQFFPLLNEMRFTCLAVARHSGNPLMLYERWIAWLGARGTSRKLARTPHYGTFQEFALFLDELVIAMLPDVPYLKDLLDFERTRVNLFSGYRSRDVANPHLTQALPRMQSRFRLANNLAIRSYEFDIPDILTALKLGNTAMAAPQKTTLAILAETGRRVTVMRLNGFAEELLLCCSEAMTVDDVVYRVRRHGSGSTRQHAIATIEEACISGLTVLQSRGLVELVSL